MQTVDSRATEKHFHIKIKNSKKTLFTLGYFDNQTKHFHSHPSKCYVSYGEIVQRCTNQWVYPGGYSHAHVHSFPLIPVPIPKLESYSREWLGSRVVSVLDSGAEGPGFKSQSRRCHRQTVHTHCASVHQAAKLVAALLRVAGVTADLAESNGSLPSGL